MTSCRVEPANMGIHEPRMAEYRKMVPARAPAYRSPFGPDANAPIAPPKGPFVWTQNSSPVVTGWVAQRQARIARAYREAVIVRTSSCAYLSPFIMTMSCRPSDRMIARCLPSNDQSKSWTMRSRNDLPHSASAQRSADLIRADSGARLEVHLSIDDRHGRFAVRRAVLLEPRHQVELLQQLV